VGLLLKRWTWKGVVVICWSQGVLNFEQLEKGEWYTKSNIPMMYQHALIFTLQSCCKHPLLGGRMMLKMLMMMILVKRWTNKFLSKTWTNLKLD
jgi:hypothetical protein